MIVEEWKVQAFLQTLTYMNVSEILDPVGMLAVAVGFDLSEARRERVRTEYPFLTDRDIENLSRTAARIEESFANVEAWIAREEVIADDSARMKRATGGVVDPRGRNSP